MRAYFGLVLAVLLPLAVQAQSPDLRRLDQVRQLHLNSAAVQAQLPAAAEQARRIAVAQTLNADQTSGSWDLADNGQSRWRLRITSPGARSLSLHLQGLQLPDQAQLWLYTSDGRDAQGPYTANNNGSLWTAQVRGEELVIEAVMPAAARAQFALQVAEVFHGFRALDGSGYPAKGAFGTSGQCTIDVACSDGRNWQNEARSTLLLTVGNQFLCSATLVNNTAQDDRPLVLTANHCDITSSNVNTTVAYFNVQKASCGGSADGPINQNIAGKSVLATTTNNASTHTDYTLFELASKPPSGYGAYYAGWDSRGIAPSSGVGLSHPSGDDTKISTFTSPASAQDNECVGGTLAGHVCSGGFTVDTWALIWTRGTTEGGSSGSGLWNQDHHLVGTLSGGDSACASSNSTSNNGGTDLYARLDHAWAASSGTGVTLMQVLDAVNSGCTTLNGKNQGAASAVSCGGISSGGGGGSCGLGLLPLLFGGLLQLRRRARAGQLTSRRAASD